MAPRDLLTSQSSALPVVASSPARTMGRGEWTILGLLALIWGSAFLFIKVAVGAFDPVTYVWLRLVIAATALMLFARVAGHRLRFPAIVWASVNARSPWKAVSTGRC